MNIPDGFDILIWHVGLHVFSDIISRLIACLRQLSLDFYFKQKNPVEGSLAIVIVR